MLELSLIGPECGGTLAICRTRRALTGSARTAPTGRAHLAHPPVTGAALITSRYCP